MRCDGGGRAEREHEQGHRHDPAAHGGARPHATAAKGSRFVYVTAEGRRRRDAARASAEPNAGSREQGQEQEG